MEGDKYIHIVSFDIPYPPNYGGVIDVFYKIKYLSQAGIKIILHCFQYNGKTASEELEQYCYKVYYYPRDVSFQSHFHWLPYTVKSRAHKELLNNLLKDNYPILFETLHCAYYINHPSLKNRKKILRLSNIEHHYYFHLFIAERHILKKIYFLIESIKLYFFEKKAFHHANDILPVTTADDSYIKKYYSKAKSTVLPSFHSFNDISVWKGKGEYVLYHGNLSIAENYQAAAILIDKIAPQIDMPIIIAGKNPPPFLIKKSTKHPHVQIVANLDDEEMKQLIQNAHIVWLFTHQPTGLKLKMLHSLFTARFIICNDKMLAGTGIQSNYSLYIKRDEEETIESIKQLKLYEFDDVAIMQRQQILSSFDNKTNLKKLLNILYSDIPN